MEQFYFTICHVVSILMLLCSWQLMIKKHVRDMPILIFNFLAIGVIFITRTIFHYFKVDPITGTSNNLLLLALYIISTYSSFTFRRLYPKVSRDWRVVIAYFPFFFMLFMLYFLSGIGYSFRPFDAREVIFTSQIFHLDVFYRYLIYFLIVAIPIYLFILTLKRRRYDRFLVI
ncbi:MAG: hypothetical protein SNF69_05725 [Rikenellaceae bacterium]